MYTFKITYIFIIYNLNTFFSYISISVHSTLFNLCFFFIYWCYIASLLCYSYVCLYYHACLHYLNKKWSDKDTECTSCVYCILKWWKIVEITRISAFHGYMTVFVSDDFTLSPLGVPPAGRWILKGLKELNSNYWINGDITGKVWCGVPVFLWTGVKM